ncbi:MAG: EamA family transporter [Pseudomonadota bacterium]
MLGLLSVLWGSSYLFIKFAVAEIPPLTLIAMRVLIAAILLATIARLQGAQFPRDKQTWGQLLVQAFLNSIGAWTLLAWGQQFIDSALASVLNSTSPLFVFFMTAFILGGRKPGLIQLIGAILGVAGAVLIVGLEAMSGLSSGVWGQIAALGGAALYAGAAIYGRRFSHLPPTVTAAGTMIWATVWLVPASLIFEAPWALAPSNQAIGAALILGVFCTGAALMIYFRLIHTLGPLGTTSQSYLRIGVGVALGVVVLGESFTTTAGIGYALAILGVALINLPRRTA